jgi:hypothetical protein
MTEWGECAWVRLYGLVGKKRRVYGGCGSPQSEAQGQHEKGIDGRGRLKRCIAGGIRRAFRREGAWEERRLYWFWSERGTFERATLG